MPWPWYVSLYMAASGWALSSAISTIRHYGFIMRPYRKGDRLLPFARIRSLICWAVLVVIWPIYLAQAIFVE